MFFQAGHHRVPRIARLLGETWVASYVWVKKAKISDLDKWTLSVHFWARFHEAF
jgi:hypothetical protein